MEDGLQKAVRRQDIFNVLRCTPIYGYLHDEAEAINFSTDGCFWIEKMH